MPYPKNLLLPRAYREFAPQLGLPNPQEFQLLRLDFHIEAQIRQEFA